MYTAEQVKKMTNILKADFKYKEAIENITKAGDPVKILKIHQQQHKWIDFLRTMPMHMDAIETISKEYLLAPEDAAPAAEEAFWKYTEQIHNITK